MERTNVRTARRTIRTLTLSVLTAGALAACGGNSAAPRATTAPTVAPSIDDSSVSIVPPSAPASTTPSPTTAPTADGTTARQGASTAPIDSVSTSGGGLQAASRSAPGVTVPGLADGAVALPTTVTVAPQGRCRSGSLRLLPLDLQGSPGGTYANFRLLNTSASPCAVRGYVGARLIDDSGRDMVTSVRHEDGPDVWVRIAPKGSAQFHLRFPNPFSGSTPCNPPNAARVRISVPGTAGTLTGTTPDGGIQACHGEVSTAPVGST